MVESLPASLRSLTIEGRVRSFEQQTVPAARQLAAESRRAAEARRPLAPLCERLRRLAQEEQEAQAKRAALAEERSRVESLLDTDPALAEALLELREARDRGCAAVQAKLDSLKADREKQRQAHDEAAAELESLTALEEAARGFRFWSGAWWKARVEKDLPER